MVAIITKNSLHCPQCGQSFHAEKNRGEHSVYDFVCSMCRFEFRMQYDSRRQVYLPLIERSLLTSFTASLHEIDLITHSSENLLTEQKSSLLPGATLKSSSSPSSTANKSEIENRDYDPIALRIKQKWQEVLEDFNTSELHAQFIDLCHQLGRLDFAKERYDYLKQALGEDHEVDKRLRQIDMKLLQRQEVMERLANEDQKIPYWRRFGTLFMIAVLLGLVGTLLPSLRWVSFLGIFILAGLLFYSIKK